MCNVIILLNKPLEEDIPFTTSSEAGTFQRCLFVFFMDVKMSMLLNLECMIFYCSILEFALLLVHCNLSFANSHLLRQEIQRTASFENSINTMTTNKNRRKDILAERNMWKISIYAKNGAGG